jgi:hypothetical protein
MEGKQEQQELQEAYGLISVRMMSKPKHEGTPEEDLFPNQGIWITKLPGYTLKDYFPNTNLVNRKSSLVNTARQKGYRIVDTYEPIYVKAHVFSPLRPVYRLLRDAKQGAWFKVEQTETLKELARDAKFTPIIKTVCILDPVDISPFVSVQQDTLKLLAVYGVTVINVTTGENLTEPLLNDPVVTLHRNLLLDTPDEMIIPEKEKKPRREKTGPVAYKESQADLIKLIIKLRGKRKVKRTWQDIADKLNASGYKPQYSKAFTASNVSNIYKRNRHSI